MKRKVSLSALLGSLLALSGAPAFDAPPLEEFQEGADILLQQARAMLADGTTILFHEPRTGPIRLSPQDIWALQNRKLLLMIPREDSPYDIRVRSSTPESPFITKDVHVFAKSSDKVSLWWSSMSTITTTKRSDYFLSMSLGNFESSAQGDIVEGTRLLNWRQNNEFRLVSLTSPDDPSDPKFSLIVEDEIYVTIATPVREDRRMPEVVPAINFRPLNLGVSVHGGKRTRYKISVGAGYALSTLPFAGPNAATQGYLRLQLRFR